MKMFKFTFVGKGSELANALENDEKLRAAGKDTKRTVEVPNPQTGKVERKVLPPLSEEVYNKTTERYEAMYSEEDRAWFAQFQKQAFANAKANPKAYE